MPRKYEILENGTVRGDLTIVNYILIEKNNNYRQYYKCVCFCGVEKLIRKDAIDNNTTKSCGCSRKTKRFFKKENKIGKRYGKLLITDSFVEKRKTMYVCICDCGNNCNVWSSDLRRRKSCGCLHFERKNTQENLERQLYNSYKYSASERGLDFELTKPQFIALVNGNCFYCGIEKCNPIKDVHKLKEIRLFNGIDRVNNSKSYTVDNCVSCCKTCNIAKRGLSKIDFKNWVDRIYLFMKKTNWEV